MLEMVTGRHAGVDSGEVLMLAEWIKRFWDPSHPDLQRIVDPRLNGQYSEADAMKMVLLGIHCINDLPSLRPDMSVVVQKLDELHQHK